MIGRVKSSVDDFVMERGTVSMRVAFVLRSVEVQLLFRDLLVQRRCAGIPIPHSSVAKQSLPPSPYENTTNATTPEPVKRCT